MPRGRVGLSVEPMPAIAHCLTASLPAAGPLPAPWPPPATASLSPSSLLPLLTLLQGKAAPHLRRSALKLRFTRGINWDTAAWHSSQEAQAPLNYVLGRLYSSKNLLGESQGPTNLGSPGEKAESAAPDGKPGWADRK